MNLENIEAGFTKEQLQAILDTLSSEGWRIIQHDMRLYRKQLDTTNNLETEAELHYLKGELKTLDWFIELQEWYKAADYETNL